MGSICYALSVLLFVHLGQLLDTFNVLTKSYKENRKLKPVLITLTVKNGTDLRERADHLLKSFRTLLERRRDYLKKGWGYNEFCKVQGAMYSYENTYNEKTGEWHPHIHIFALVDSWIDQQEFASIGIRLQAIHTLWTFAGRKKKRVQATQVQPQKSVSTL